MTEYKEFEGKTVDAAIEEACRHFGVERDKLEIEIMDGGSRGIFGLGKKNARVNARRRTLGTERTLLDGDEFLKELRRSTLGAPQSPAPKETESARPRATEQRPAERPVPTPKETPAPAAPKPAEQAPVAAPTPQSSSPRAMRSEAQPRAERPAQAPRIEQGAPAPRTERPAQAPAPRPAPAQATEAAPAPTPRVASQLPAPTPEQLESTALEIMTELLRPLASDPRLTVSHESGRVKVRIEDEASSGLIIGREGQTIAAMQYIANRIVARRFDTPVRVHLDAGDYRDKQDDNLRKMALHLADKARSLGRTQSTKPLSSYHRRLVHLALQDDETVQTRSKGDGPLKRVIIYPKRDRAAKGPTGDE
ncbi:spoIIIJ-associated protein [Desulfobaculum xiamenense]|uniref:RNA-binding protein KhpB n=1 Tax=Desulfobaculum xiamenense TaxID=995050 RepID=A0A846QUR2_9BACT|nr:RNA-binding cell elongation regulator Jag/EloR [Desulfobaculum xiamenense]NJB68389.1 spoIIIJ-associated protein [Desulfobaculum xiamenense]